MDENAAFCIMRRRLTCTFLNAERNCGAVCGFTNRGEVGEEDDDEDRKLARRKLMIAIGLCFSFMIVEVIGGTLQKSSFARAVQNLKTSFPESVQVY